MLKVEIRILSPLTVLDAVNKFNHWLEKLLFPSNIDRVDTS